MIPARPRFLTGAWRHLAMFNYACEPALLTPHVPYGTELDRHGDTTVVSLVGFCFQDTRVLGIPVPFHEEFEEVNLRFYIRRREPEGWRRGVVFIKEIVPKAAIAAVARLAYNENYVAMPMRHRLDLDDADGLRDGGLLEYTWGDPKHPTGMRCRIASPAETIAVGSEAEFITEHYRGYTVRRDGGTLEYEVAHPRWRVHRVTAPEVFGDMSATYGDAFARVLAAPPVSAFVAEGSEIIVRQGRRLPRA